MDLAKKRKDTFSSRYSERDLEALPTTARAPMLTMPATNSLLWLSRDLYGETLSPEQQVHQLAHWLEKLGTPRLYESIRALEASDPSCHQLLQANQGATPVVQEVNPDSQDVN